MLGEFPGDAWHIGWAPGKCPPALTEELDERVFLCGGESYRHPSCFGRICRVDLDLVGVFAGVECQLWGGLLRHDGNVHACCLLDVEELLVDPEGER